MESNTRKSFKKTLEEAILNCHPHFTEEVLLLGLNQFEEKTCKAKDLVLREGSICDYLIFAESSVTRCFYKDQDGKNETLWMKPEQTFITEYKSFVHRKPSAFSLQVYEDTKILRIHRDQLLNLYRVHKSWAMFGLLLTEHLHITLIDVFVNLLANDATRNYQYIAYAFPKFLQVAPLKDIASMLQVSQVTLSRIRAGTQTKS